LKKQKINDEESEMLDKLKDLFKEGLEYTHVAGLLQQMANITNIVHVQYMKDGASKNEAIDHICAMLQKHKVVPDPVPEAPAPTQPVTATLTPVEASNAPS
jgi:hypothetical protein